MLKKNFIDKNNKKKCYKKNFIEKNNNKNVNTTFFFVCEILKSK